MEKIQIRDKHPGSATLSGSLVSFHRLWSVQDKGDSDGEVVFLHQSARESGDDVALKIRADFGLPESEDSDSSYVTLPEALQQQHQQLLPAALKEKNTVYSGK